MADAQREFHRRYRQLERLTANASGEDFRDTSHILRLFLVDGGKLTDPANRPYRLKLRFPGPRNISNDPMLNPGTVILWERASQGTESSSEVKIDEYLNTPFLRLQGETLTRKDVIKIYANQLGGVHFGPSGNDDSADSKIEQMNQRFHVNDIPAIDIALSAICEEVLQALRPLFEIIDGEQ